MKDEPDESDAGRVNRTSRPIEDPGIGRFVERLREAIGTGSIRAFAARTAMSEGALRTYLRGESFPTLDRLDQIAKAAGRPPGWFIGALESPGTATRLDAGTLRLALEIVENAASLLGLPPQSSARAGLVARVYELIAGASDPTAALPAALQMVRAELAPPPSEPPTPSPRETEPATFHKFGPTKRL